MAPSAARAFSASTGVAKSSLRSRSSASFAAASCCSFSAFSRAFSALDFFLALPCPLSFSAAAASSAALAAASSAWRCSA